MIIERYLFLVLAPSQVMRQHRSCRFLQSLVASLAKIAGTTVSAGGETTLWARGDIYTGAVSGDAGVFAFAMGDIDILGADSASGSVTVLTNGSISQLDVTAGGDVLVAALGSSVFGALSGNVMAGGDVTLFGSGAVTADAVAGGDLWAVGYGKVMLTFTAGGDAYLGATGELSVNGTTGGDARLVSYSVITGAVDAGDDLSVWALGDIKAVLRAADNVESVVTFGSLTGSVEAGFGGDPGSDVSPEDGYGVIRRVHIWDDLTGSVVAYDLIGDLTTGGVIDPDAVVLADAFGRVVEYDRSAFVEDPMVPVARVGELVALARDTYIQLLDLQRDLQGGHVVLRVGVLVRVVRLKDDEEVGGSGGGLSEPGRLVQPGCFALLDVERGVAKWAAEDVLGLGSKLRWVPYALGVFSARRKNLGFPE